MRLEDSKMHIDNSRMIYFISTDTSVILQETMVYQFSTG